jgi:tetratricopeptide (TPR) repeat protein
MYEYQLAMNPKNKRHILDDKRLFYKKYSDFFVHKVADIKDLKNKAKVAEEILSNPSGKLVFKEADGKCGAQVKIKESKDFDRQSMITYMEQHNYGLVEEFVEQHRELNRLSPSAVNTVRIFTQLNDQGDVDILGCRLRISVDSPVDNMGAGNLAAPIDEKTGQVNGSGVYSDITKPEQNIHPITKVQIKGFQIPFWDETLQMIKKAALLHPENRSIGWDVVITERGPGLIEGNHDWCKLLWQLPHKEQSKGTRTFDLRLWDDVKGQGGFHAAAGEEWVRDVKYQRFNVLTHEFTHQVHSILTQKQRDKITSLYQQAKKEGWTLDSYADFNEMEYLAQGVEAYISEAKFPDQKGTSGHTRADLKEKDPELFRFISELNNRKSYRGNEIRAYREKGFYMLGRRNPERAVAIAEEGLQHYGNHPDLFELLGQSERIRGNYKRAIKVDKKIIDKFPDDARGYINLAEDIVLAEHDFDRAVKILQKAQQNYPNSFELQMALAKHSYDSGNPDQMKKVIEGALELIESPNPYASYPEPWYLLARGYLSMKEYAEAEKALRRSLEQIDRQNPAGWADLAFIYHQTDSLKEGKKYLSIAKTLNSADVRVQEVEAQFLIFEGETNRARDLLEQALDQYPQRLQILVLLSTIAEEKDSMEEKQYIDQGLEIISKRAPVEFVWKDNSYVAMGRWNARSAAYLYTRAAELAEDRNEINQAREYHRKAVQYFSHNFESMVELIRLYGENDDLKAAKRLYQQLQDLESPKLYLKQGKRYLEMFSNG